MCKSLTPHLIACDQTTAGDNPQTRWDGEKYQEIMSGQTEIISKYGFY